MLAAKIRSSGVPVFYPLLPDVFGLGSYQPQSRKKHKRKVVWTYYKPLRAVPPPVTIMVASPGAVPAGIWKLA